MMLVKPLMVAARWLIKFLLAGGTDKPPRRPMYADNTETEAAAHRLHVRDAVCGHKPFQVGLAAVERRVGQIAAESFVFR